MERQKILGVYPRSKPWQTKVKQMSESQVKAIYISFRRRGLLK